MMKFLFILLIFLPVFVNANMASPIRQGTLVANPFLSDNVSITEENINIEIDKNFQYASFKVEYYIYADKAGINIPLLFFASQYYSGFKVRIDDKPISLKRYNINEAKLENYEYLYKGDSISPLVINNVFQNGRSESIRVEDFLYFETPISVGKHVISVEYVASAWRYKHSRMNETSFRYILLPAKFWRSFGLLNVTLDARKYHGKISSNLGIPFKGDINAISTYHYSSLPTDAIIITEEPILNGFTKFLLALNYFNLSLLIMLPFVFLHYKLIKTYRRQNSNVKWSIKAVSGGVLIPILFIFVLIGSSFLIDYFMGNYASGSISYGVFFSFFKLPKFIFYYLTLSIIVDFVFKRIYNITNVNENQR